MENIEKTRRVFEKLLEMKKPANPQVYWHFTLAEKRRFELLRRY